jgi:predicted RecA/RadA family phage recombinase
MKNFIENGDVIVVPNADVTGAVDLASGDGFVVGSLFGVCVTDIAVGDSGPIKTRGVFDLAKTTSQAWTLGQKIYWSAATGKATSTASSNKLIGVASEAADSAAATGKVLVTGAASN